MIDSEVWTADRLDRARSRMADLDVDGLFVTPGSDLRYLAGYGVPALSRMTCFVVPARGEPVLVVPKLEAEEARASAAGRAGVTVRTWDETEDPAMLAASALPHGSARVALSGKSWFDHALELQSALGGLPLISGAPVLSHLRMYKGADEVAAVREAAAAMDRVQSALAAGEVAVVGRTEREIFIELVELMVSFGHVEGFGNVASGPNAASPHHKPGDRRLGEGDVLLVDLAGPMASGYRSDCTRTLCVGSVPDDEFAHYYSVVDRANAAALALAAPGVLAADLDRAARDVITEAGYGEAFLHRTGHGIGLDVHEPPFLLAGNDLRLEPGMCFSIEPGIYLPGRHGARIEDIVTITETGVERLNLTSHELSILSV